MSERNMPLIQPGDLLPDSLYQIEHRAFDISANVSTSIRLEDYRDRMIILDFWFNGCKPCIMSLNELDSIQSIHGDDRWIIIPFTYQSEENSSRAFERYKWNFKSIVSDTILRKLFFGNGFQNMVWIKDGKVIATPPSSFATWNNMSKVLNGKEPDMPQRAEMQLALNPYLPIFIGDNGGGAIRYKVGTATISGYVPDYRTEYLTHTNISDSTVLYCNNLTIDQLFFEAYKHEIRPEIPKEYAVVWNVSPALKKVLFAPRPNLLRTRTLEDYELIREWRKQNYYGYTRRAPGNLTLEQAAGFMQNDLNAFFGSQYNLTAKIESSPYIYPALRCLDRKESTMKLLTDASRDEEHGHHRTNNESSTLFSDLITIVYDALQHSDIGSALPFVNDTGIALATPVWYDLPNGIAKGQSIKQVNSELKRYGLVIEIVERNVPLLHINEINPK